MCRFILYMGTPITIASLITQPRNSLINQSFRSEEREEPLNGDGFGIAWYEPGVDERPGLFRSVGPAWSNRNLNELARMTVSPCLLAHVRAATQTFSVSEANCHPFVHGRYAFMHNGDLGGFRVVRRKFLERLSDEAFGIIEGTTDSEHLFALFLDALLDRQDEDPVEAMAAALRATLGAALDLANEAGKGEECYLNIAVSDGTGAVVCRCTTDPEGFADSLYLHAGHRYICEDGVCRMEHAGGQAGAVIVSSERLSDDPGWEPIPINHLVLVRPGLAKVEPLGVS